MADDLTPKKRRKKPETPMDAILMVLADSEPSFLSDIHIGLSHLCDTALAAHLRNLTIDNLAALQDTAHAILNYHEENQQLRERFQSQNRPLPINEVYFLATDTISLGSTLSIEQVTAIYQSIRWILHLDEAFRTVLCQLSPRWLRQIQMTAYDLLDRDRLRQAVQEALDRNPTSTSFSITTSGGTHYELKYSKANKAGKRTGPYLHLRWYEGVGKRKHKSHYLGKALGDIPR